MSDEEAASLEQLVMQRAGWRDPDDFPERLYHYTSSGAFMNIVESGELWLSDYRYMNDLSEMNYGLNLFVEELSRREAVEKDARLRGLFIALRKQFDAARVYTDVFVFSMCSADNLLNQWRVYGRDAVPISMEFGTRGFLRFEWKPYSFDIVPMLYDVVRQKDIVTGAVSTISEYALAHAHRIFTNQECADGYIEDCAAICVDVAMPFKHPQFDVEGEWRLASRWGLEHRILSGHHHRSSPSGIVPYIAVRPVDISLPLSRVTIGPCAYPDIQKRTIQTFLFQHGHVGVDVVTSDLPIRI